MIAIREMYDLVKRLTSRGHVAIEHFLDPEYSSTKLLRGIEDGRYHDDESATQDMFGQVKNEKKRSQSFRKTKYDLIRRLINLHMFLVIRSETHPEYKVNAYAAKKELLVAEVCQWFQCHEAMKLLARRVLVKARHYHLTYEHIRSAEILRNYHTLRGPAKDCLAYAEEAAAAGKVYQAELEASNIHAVIKSELTSKLALDMENSEMYATKCKELKTFVDKHQSRQLWQVYSDTAGLVFRQMGKTKKALEVYEAFAHFLDVNKHLGSAKRQAQICFYLLRCHLTSRNYLQAQEVIQHSEQYLEFGTFNWYRHKLIHCITYMHDQKWELAAETFIWVIQQPNFHKENIRVELWSVIEGYLRFFCDQNSLIPEDKTVHGKVFNLHHLLQEIEFSRIDKAGMNVAVMIFQGLTYLQQRQFELLDGRIDAMRNYRAKFLKKDTSGRFKRTQLLFQMFSSMKTYHYDISKIRRHTNTKLKLLKTYSNPEMNPTAQIEEFVPYDCIWDRVLTELELVHAQGIIVNEYSSGDGSKTLLIDA